MPLNTDLSSALRLLEYVQTTIKECDDIKLQAQTADELNLLISVLENPIFRSIVQIQDSLGELNSQIQQHPSILPVDFDVNLAGELVLNLPPPIFETEDFISSPNHEVDDQRVPVAKLSQSSSGEPNSPPTISVASMNEAPLAPITTTTYALEFQKAVDESSEGRDVITVKLYKPEGCSLGFSVVGLRSEEKGELGIFIQEIQPSGIAGRDGRLHEGDQILAIDGQPLDSNISHPEAISILQKARGLVELIVARSEDAHPPSASPSPSPSAISETSKAGSDMVLNTEWAQVEVIDLVNDGSGLGFGIIGGRSTGVVVKTILPTGVADRDGRLQSGDHILQIGDVNLRGMGSEQVAAVLRQSGSEVRLVVARPVEPTSPDYQALGSHAPIVPTKILGDPEELDRHLIQNGYPQVTYNSTTPSIEPYDNPFVFHEDTDLELLGRQDPRMVVDIVPVTSLPLPFLTMDMLPLDAQLPEMERFTVELKKDTHGLGITIAGYVCEKEELSGIFVKSISSGSAADLCKKIQVNDRIVEVDGKSLQGYTNHDAVEVLRSTGGTVRLSLERYLRGPKFEQLQQAIANSELNKPPTPSSPSALSLPRFPVSADGESTEVEVEGESITTVDSACLAEANNPDVDLDDVDLFIDMDFEGPLKSTVETAIKAKWSKIMGPDVEIVVGQLTKFGEGGGLGISLEGTVDVEDGQEVRPHHYIRSILAEGPVGRNGVLKSGDELLEVNGHRLLGMNHMEVVTILKELPRAVRMVCARRAGEGNALRLIDTSQDRAAFAARSLLGGSLQNLLPAMERLVKAKSDGSLASTTTAATEPSLSKLRSRSLEPITGLAMWSSEPHIIELVKGERGLGFSILDYQDPMNPSETVIVIRSLVPGGVAQMDGRLIPGDRLLSVNSVALDNASLDQAVQALKGAPKGIVRIVVAKPLPIPDSVSNSQEGEMGVSQDTPTIDDRSMYSCSGSSLSLADETAQIAPDELLEKSDVRFGKRDDSEDKQLLVPLPASLETEIIINKGNNHLGVTVERASNGANGMVVTELVSSGALAIDGRILVGDMITALNNESLRFVAEAQAKAIFARVHSLSTDISFRVIKKKQAIDYLKTCLQRSILRQAPSSPSSPRTGNQLFSEIQSKFRSPILSPLGCESASDRESEYVDCDCIDDRTDASSPLNAPSVTLVRKISASSYDIDNRFSRPEAKVNEAKQEIKSPLNVAPIEKSQLSVSDDSLDFVRQDRTLVINYIYPIRERSLESLNSKRSVNESVELTKGVSEPVLSNRIRKSVQVREMTVTANHGSVLIAKHWGPQRSVVISRDLKSSLGISIVGGKVDLYNSGPDSSTTISGIFIKNILPNSPAGQTDQLKAGDRILEVDGVDLRQASHEYAVNVIRSASNPVAFLVQSLVKWSTNGGSISACSSVKGISCDELETQSLSDIDLLSSATEESTDDKHLSQEEDVSEMSKVESLSTADKTRASRSTSTSATKVSEKSPGASSQPQMSPQKFALIPSVPKVVPSSDDEEDSDEDDSYRDMEGRIRTAGGVEISRASAGNVKRSKEEAANDPEKEDYFGYTSNKVKKKYSNLGADLVIVEFEKTPSGLGLSLAGHKDRNKMAVLICGLNPHGLASKSGTLQVGDEILEVNGVVLHGRCHLNASAMMKGITGPVYKIIALRKTDALQELSVKPITQFPLSIEEETPEQRYSSFKGVRTISIRKPDNLERRHASESHVTQTGQGLGIMIIEGKHAEVGQGIFISDIQEGSAAHQAGLSVGDMILAVNRDTLIGSNYDNAASLLKKTEGMVTLVVCNPNRAKDDENKSSELTVNQATPSPAHSKSDKSGKLSQTGTPSNSKLAAPPGTLSPSPSAKFKMDGEDAAPTAPIVPGTESCIEITKDKVLGLSIVGGSDTLLGVIIINEIFPDGAAAKDGRLKPGDQILEFNNENFRTITHGKAVSMIHQAPAKVRLVAFRCEDADKPEASIEVLEVDIAKKNGKGLGLSIAGRKSGPGILISEIINGGAAYADGRIMKGDQILAVNGEDTCNVSTAEAAMVLKTATGKVALKLGRFKARQWNEGWHHRVMMLNQRPGFNDLHLYNVSDSRGFMYHLPNHVKFIVRSRLIRSLLKV